ncbi:alpha/beta fold hydrolase [Nocardia sp. CDC159]|uniref:Alpha/beta fold hydrolase n=1 Tax=Nocardia pulmonis TaxID=2951408 RepID=A0A9X2IXP9_9NOCA|nr:MULTISPECIES: alpha/beta fold hydrolase [Nocardia]MCM6774100.1 alpha/beta fold hydrolase [Nocardia pulmonis]MCM6786987.1 alpha/beta fold hydrolase [Nocardia sp. CDC159]
MSTFRRRLAVVTPAVSSLLAIVAITLFPGRADAIPEEPATGPLPVPFDLGAGILPGLFPESPPPGANDWNCKPAAQHPNPVILINSTATNQALAFAAGSPFLKNNGFCVFTFNYGNPAWLPGEIPLQSLDDIPNSARTLGAEVDRVLAATGATKVDLVGHSQGGGLLPLYYINVLGGNTKVDKMVGISPSNHGTTLSDIAFLRSFIPPVGWWIFDALGLVAPALTQQAIDAPLIEQIYGDGDTRPGVTYTTIVTRYDEIVTPYDQQYLHGPDVTDITLQDGCPADRSDHIATLYSERAWRFVLDALSPSTAMPVPCIRESPFFPGVH